MRRSAAGRPSAKRHGRRHTPKTTAALAMRSQATPSGATRANSSTAKDGPRWSNSALIMKNACGGMRSVATRMGAAPAMLVELSMAG